MGIWKKRYQTYGPNRIAKKELERLRGVKRVDTSGSSAVIVEYDSRQIQEYQIKRFIDKRVL